MRRRATAIGILAAGLAGTGAVVRLAQPGDPEALTVAAEAVVPRGAPGLIVVTDPHCPACVAALAELREVVRPEELGLAVRVLEHDGGGRPLLEAVGPGLVPLLVVVDAAGAPVAAMRGPRPPEAVRAWLESALARIPAMPLDRGAARGPP